MKKFLKAKAQQELNKELEKAICDSDLDDVACLIARGCDVNFRDEKGMTPLLHAAFKDPSVLVHTQDFAVEDHQKIIKLLVENGADVNAQKEVDICTPKEDEDLGKTALMFFAIRKENVLVEFLLKHGAKVLIRDDKGKTAKDYAWLHYKSETNASYTLTLEHLKEAEKALGSKFNPLPETKVAVAENDSKVVDIKKCIGSFKI